jgi:hypothetical protein
MSADDVHVRAPADELSSLLAVVAGDGWGSAAGNQAIRIMRKVCRREASRWTHKAGWLTEEGLAPVWEQMDRLVRAGRFDDAPGLLRLAARRAYAAEAAAMQTGMGSASTRFGRGGGRWAARSGVDANVGRGVGDGGLGLAGVAVGCGDGVGRGCGVLVAAVPVGDGRA